VGAKEEEIVLKFIGAFRDSWPDDLDEPLALLAEDASYTMIEGLTDPVRGRAAIKAEWERMLTFCPQQKHEMKAVGSSDRFVFTERVDYAYTNNIWAAIPLCAVFEVADGKIVRWREYLDPACVARQLNMSPEEFGDLID
jgi:limonene-1,2-epoxide hydrolase